MSRPRNGQRPLATVLAFFAGALLLSQVLLVAGAAAGFALSGGRIGAALFGSYLLVYPHRIAQPGQALEPGAAEALLADLRNEQPGLEPEWVDTEDGPGLRLHVRSKSETPYAELRAVLARHGLELSRFSTGPRFLSTLERLVGDPLSTASVTAWTWVLLPAPLSFLLLGWRGRRRYVPVRVARLGLPKGIAAGLAVGAAAFGAAWLLESALARVGLPVAEQGIVLALLDQGGAVRLALIAVAVLVAPVGEELFFRGFAFDLLLEQRGPVVAHLVSGVLFALVHFNPGGTAIYLLLAAILAESYRRSGSLLVPVIAHGTLNAATLTAYLGG